MIKLPKYQGPVSDNFNGEKFINPWLGLKKKSISEFIRWQKSRVRPKWPRWVDVENSASPLERVHHGLELTFINHATILIQCGGLNIITDPVLGQTIGPFPGVGLRRRKAPGVKFEHIPPIDYVLLSHNHYDHMDIPTLKKLDKKFNMPIYTGLGNKVFLNRNGLRVVEEMDWWQTRALKNDVELVAVPAQHWSQRWWGDTNRSLWMGFVLKTKLGAIYFAGDTGFGPHFEEIRKRLGPMTYSLIPIGAYLPRWFMKDSHMEPIESVRAHKILGSRKTLGIHFGSFPLADEAYGQEVRDLEESLRLEHVPPGDFITLQNGEKVTWGQ